jgi:nucleotide-binding universal stress UspA family protein
MPAASPIIGPEAALGADSTLELRDWCEDKLREQIARLGIRETELAGAEVLAGTPHRVLVDAAGKAGADLLVVGATGSGPVAAELLGSTADRVLRKASCPVLVVRGELPVPPRRVLAPVDLSPLSGDSYRCGLDLLAQLGRSEEIEVRTVYAASLAEKPARQCTEELRRFMLDNRAGASFDLETAVLPGEARAEILHEIDENPVDLVLLGTHGRGGLDRLMLGSVASAVARKAPCSVLLISPDAALGDAIAEAVLDRTTPAWTRETAAVG